PLSFRINETDWAKVTDNVSRIMATPSTIQANTIREGNLLIIMVPFNEPKITPEEQNRVNAPLISVKDWLKSTLKC
nr:hypothetical protein [Bacteroidia bacterium]